MINLNKEKVPVRYIIGIDKILPGYPSALDVLYESCIESPDETLFSRAKMENRYGINDESIDRIINELSESGYVVNRSSKIKIIDTPWH